MAERNWTGLDEDQADGRACVACGRDFRTPGSVSVPVGRSHTGSQVFACVDRCQAAATAGEAALPLWVPVEVIDALCDASSGVFRAELEAAVRETVAPLIVAAELRRLADVLDGWAAPTGMVLPDPATTGVIAGRLRARAAELDPTGR